VHYILNTDLDRLDVINNFWGVTNIILYILIW